MNKNIQTEVDACYLYRKLADNETEETIASVFHQMSEIEKSHAEAFLQKQKIFVPAGFSVYNLLLKNKFPETPMYGEASKTQSLTCCLLGVSSASGFHAMLHGLVMKTPLKQFTYS
jgi:Rubrerythrin